MSTVPATPDPTKVDALLDCFVADLGAAVASANAIIGDRLGLYRGLAAGGPQTARELAERTGQEQRFMLEERAPGGTKIAVHVEVPDEYGIDLEGQRAVIGMSLRQLADVAAQDAAALA